MARSSAALKHRDFEILHSIVRSYIETGEPVASRTISRARKDGLSAASIRNAMADLCDAGYLCQPHTSAGRVPTEKAFRSYVQSLAKGRVLLAELERLRAELSQIGTMQERVERSSHMLTEMTRSIGITAAIPNSSQLLDQVELILLAGHRILMIVATRDQSVHHRVVNVDEPITQDELVSIRNYINHNFGDWTLSQIHIELRLRLEQESAVYDQILRKLTVLYQKGLLDIGLLPEIHMEGTSNLVDLDLHLTREKMRELFRALEEKKRILHLLDRFLEQRPGELAVQVGLGDVDPSMKQLSLIGLSIEMPGGLSAKLAVIGPMRMNYERVMSAVMHMGQAFQDLRV